MNYTQLYTKIIDNARQNNRSKKESYFELHHIVPRCLGGSDDKENLVLLTAKEHFICHHLLTKIYPDNQKINSAFWLMHIFSSGNQQRYFGTSRTYNTAKEIQSKIARQKWVDDNPNKYRDISGENNPMFGSCRTGKDNPFFGKTHTEETKQKIREKNSKKIWSEDEKQKLKDSWKNRELLKCPYCPMESIHASNMRRYHFDKCKFKN